MIISPNPLQAHLPELRRPASDGDIDTNRDHDTLRSVALTLDQLLYKGEIHDEIVDRFGTMIPHRLGRRPLFRVILRQDGNQVLYDDYEQWNDKKISLYVSAGTMRVVFWLFALVASLLPLGAGAAECARYGYAQKQAIRFWLCDFAANATTEAADGDYRYNKDTNGLQTFDGSTWNTVGGGGGSTPTGTGYVHVTAGVQDGAADLVTLTSATDVAPNQGSTVTVFHGNAAGQGAFGPVALASDVSGILPILGGGTGDSSAPADTVMVGDGTNWNRSSIPSCTDGSGRHLNYSTVTDLFSCGTSSSGGGGSNALEVSIDLGSSGGLVFTSTVTGQAWVTSTSRIVCTPFATTADGLTVETVYAAGVTAVVSNKVVGTGFDLTVLSPHGATGTYRMSCIGA